MKTAILICSYNRPQYLRQCLYSIERADLSQVETIMIVDDCSTDRETIELIDNFEVPGVQLIKSFSKKNRSIKGSLLHGLDLLTPHHDVVMNLDADAIVRFDFVEVLLNLKLIFPEHIATGFNCLTKNKNGSVRHKVIMQGINYNTKASVGGINMVFNKKNYDDWIRPALVKCIEHGGNWDHQSCLASGRDGFNIVCAVPSVVQHIGIDSSMNHGAGGEPPDVSEDFVSGSFTVKNRSDGETTITINEESLRNAERWEKDFHRRMLLPKLKLPMVTLVGADCIDIDRLIRAADICCKDIEFGAVKLLSSIPLKDPRVHKIDHFNTKSDYSKFMMKGLACWLETSHVLIIQHDGFVLNAAAWRNEWLQYDYIGAPWEWYPYHKVGNGGFSLRTSAIHRIIQNDNHVIPVNEAGVTSHMEEDHCICRIYREYLEKRHSVKFAPLEEARKFSIEGWNSPNRTWDGQFGFHGAHVNLSNSKIQLR